MIINTLYLVLAPFRYLPVSLQIIFQVSSSNISFNAISLYHMSQFQLFYQFISQVLSKPDFSQVFRQLVPWYFCIRVSRLTASIFPGRTLSTTLRLHKKLQKRGRLHDLRHIHSCSKTSSRTILL